MKKYFKELLEIHSDMMIDATEMSVVDPESYSDEERELFESVIDKLESAFRIIEVYEESQSDVELSLDQVKRYAMDHYEDGGHVIIECWSDDQIEDWMSSEGSTIENLDILIDIYRG